ncbi:MAG TPA: accessory gene regulator B family protein [Syntrophomonadaceae bacterium]|nr:accessory gene regulator B family protein [Syntrophomonadaceae bacterium]
MEDLSYLGFSSRWAASLAQRHNFNEEKQAELAYAIEILALNIVNTALILTLGWILGVFWCTVACLITIAAFRHNAGGGHSESPWRCALVTMMVFPLLALAGRHAGLWPSTFRDSLTVISLITGFALLIIYAPVDSPKAPIVSPLRRQRLKKLALSVMVILAVIITGLRFTSWEKASEVRMCLVFSVLWVSFNLTPWGHQFWCFIDGFMIRPERRCSG